MNNFISTYGNITIGEIIIAGVGLAFFIKLLIKIKNFIITTHDTKQQNSERIESLIASTQEIQVNFTVFMERVDEMEAKLDTIENENNKYRVASLRDKIFKDYQYYTQQEKITDSQLRNFENNISEYQKRGGNSVVLHKYAPEVRELPVVPDKRL